MEKPATTGRKRKARDDIDDKVEPRLNKKFKNEKDIKPKLKVVEKKEPTKKRANGASKVKEVIDETESAGCNTSDNVWDEAEMLSRIEKVPRQLAENFISLLTEGCTLPFIARYRKTVVDHMMPDRYGIYSVTYNLFETF